MFDEELDDATHIDPLVLGQAHEPLGEMVGAFDLPTHA